MPLTAANASREIIVGLHDVMARRMSAQAKLNTVVDLIADKLASEVCSIYLLHDGKLELYAPSATGAGRRPSAIAARGQN